MEFSLNAEQTMLQEVLNKFLRNEYDFTPSGADCPVRLVSGANFCQLAVADANVVVDRFESEMTAAHHLQFGTMTFVNFRAGE